jgi:lipoate-protein ligase A
MTERWRWLDLDRQGPYENAATMPVLVRSVMTTGEPTAQTSVWGSTHLNVGWFDDVDSTVDLDLAAELGLEVIRRQFYGGGTAFYAAEAAMMWGFLLPKGYDATGGSEGLDAQLRRFQTVISDALDRVGLGEIQFEGSSDLRWHGRKLGALTAQDVVGCDSIGGFLNLARPDLTDYLRVVRVPEDKFKDKIVKDMSEYVCTAEEVAGHPVAYEDVRDAMRAAMLDAGIEWVPSELNEGERKGVTKGSARVGDPAMVRRISSDRFRREAPPGSRVGLANQKGRKLVRAGVAIDERDVVVAALMAGDLHVSPPDTLDRVADALVGADGWDADDLRARIASVFEGDDVTQAEEVMGVTTEDLLAAVVKAVGLAMGADAVSADADR